jgi:hypothetical protein
MIIFRVIWLLFSVAAMMFGFALVTGLGVVGWVFESLALGIGWVFDNYILWMYRTINRQLERL